MKIYPNNNRHKMKSLNSSKHKVFLEFDKGTHPSQLVKKYPLKYNTLQQYYHIWKHENNEKDNIEAEHTSICMSFIRNIYRYIYRYISRNKKDYK